MFSKNKKQLDHIKLFVYEKIIWLVDWFRKRERQKTHNRVKIFLFIFLFHTNFVLCTCVEI